MRLMPITCGKPKKCGSRKQSHKHGIYFGFRGNLCACYFGVADPQNQLLFKILLLLYCILYNKSSIKLLFYILSLNFFIYKPDFIRQYIRRRIRNGADRKTRYNVYN